jgi:peptide/nickel transport system ATP-binding protein
MRHGEIMEVGSTLEMFRNPKHEYTKELLAAVPGKSWEKESNNGKPLK